MFTQIAQSSQHCTTMKVLWDFAVDIHVASFHTSRGLLQVLLTSTFYEFCQKHFGASFSSTITLLHDEGCDTMYKLSCKRNSANKFSTLLEEGRLDGEGWLLSKCNVAEILLHLLLFVAEACCRFFPKLWTRGKCLGNHKFILLGKSDIAVGIGKKPPPYMVHKKI